jgi:hypothetical protein
LEPSVIVTRRIRFAPILGALLLIVLSACAQTVEPTSEATDLPQLEWRSSDVGAVSIPGSTEMLSGQDALSVTGSGADIWGQEDAFHFAYVPVSGDVTIIGRVESLDNTHEWAKAGVMIRGGLEADAAHALMALQPDGDAELIRRTERGAEAEGTARPGVAPPTWVRLTRTGSRLTGSISHDGQQWSEVDSVDVALGDDVLVGIAVTSHNLDQPAEGIVTSVALARPGSPEPDVDQEAPDRPESVLVGDWVCPDEPIQPAYQPTMWVSTTGSDGNDGRSPDRPLRTLQAAASRVGPGDVVWVRGGVYSSAVAFRRSGTESAPIVFESAPGECAVLDGVGGGTYERVILEDVRHMVFRNFVVRNSRYQGVFLVRASDNVISHVRSHDNVGSGFGILDGHRNVLRYVAAHDNFNPPYGGDADGISVSRGEGNRIEHCMSYRNSDDGVDTWLSTGTVVEYCASFDNGWQGGDGNGFKAGGQGLTTNTTIRYSVAFGNRVNGFDWNTSPGVVFEQNTAFDNGGSGFVGSSGAMRNNLAFANARPVSGSSSQTTNSWNVGLSDPAFASTSRGSEGFLALSAGSGAIDAGTPIQLPYDGARPDLGALPYGETLATYLGVRLALAD